MVSELRVELASTKTGGKKKAPQLASVFLVNLEMNVVDATSTLYRRLLSWCKLVRIWTSMRAGDTSGVKVDRMQLTADGHLIGEIVATKTTGAGKAIGVLAFTVDGQAWLREKDWLKEGWSLFKGTITDRDFFLPLPTQDEAELSDIEPTYAQHVAATRTLLAEAIIPPMGRVLQGDLLLVPGAQMYWSEHSDRCSMPTWTADLGWRKPDRDLLGRWTPTGSDVYVRSGLATVRRMQLDVAVHFRGEADDGKQIDEATLFAKAMIYLGERGMDEDVVREQQEKFQSAAAPWPRDQRIPDERPIEAPASESENDVDFGDGDDDEPAPPDVPEEVLPEGLRVEDGPTVLKPGDYVVSLTRTSRTLHRSGACWRVPGLHYRRFKVYGAGEAFLEKDNIYDRACSQCFTGGGCSSDEEFDEA